MMHQETPPEKNPFLEDLDKLDVSSLRGLKTSEAEGTSSFFCSLSPEGADSCRGRLLLRRSAPR